MLAGVVRMDFVYEWKTLEMNGWKYPYTEYDVIVDGKSTGNQYIMGELLTEDEEDYVDEQISALRQDGVVVPKGVSDEQIYMQIKRIGIKPINY
jgi:hypothetical protein